ncbi:MAG TPA: tryptophan synthase subunit alpha [Syntrophales bacterium]|nr:tryptophan synthase subunit alpha [Syntrophales bacterium]
MRRIEKTFAGRREKGGAALVAYLTAGDPSLDETQELVLTAERAGADIVEIGVPFSDPTADGPILQAAFQRALGRGVTLASIIDMVARLRTRTDIPVVLFGYYNPIFRMGDERFAAAAAAAGADGVLVVDLPHEEAAVLRHQTDRAGMDFISLVTPTTPDERLRTIAEKASGFLYYVSITGVTGTAKPDLPSVERDVARVRRSSRLPVAVGFGISDPAQASRVSRFADAVVVGSAIARLIEEHGRGEGLHETLAAYLRSLKEAIAPSTRVLSRPGD